MPNSWGSSWGNSWSNSWGAQEGALQIVGAGGVASAESFGSPTIRFSAAQVAVAIARPRIGFRRALVITGVGGISSGERFGRAEVSLNENDLLLLLLAA